MILGIGTDICDIKRIEKSIDKHGERFLDKIYTEHEQDYCQSKSGSAGYYAKRFAAKEAIAKALATDISGSLSWTDVEIRNDKSGRPQAHLHGGAKKRLKKNTPKGYTASVHVSLSDDFPYASAFAIVEAIKDEQ